MTRCRRIDCIRPVIEGHAFCEEHRLRWLPGRPVEQPVTSPWVRKALNGTLPPKVAA